ncbi:hypothetical protein GCM10022377_10040 [Zhihengliuella alba]|uniref:Helix-turn-helix DNA binding domain protein n=1 Tax=Zhihengliuella alba TaxID=547018 RepID=A0ABP7D5G3_9MICC
MALCTTVDCELPTETYLCGRCVSDLQSWIDQAIDLAPELTVTIMRQDRLRHVAQTGGAGQKAGSMPPVSLDAVQLQQNLRSIARDATDYAADPFAAGIAGMIRDWHQKAELLVSGPKPEFIDHAALQERIANIAPPMPTRQLLAFLREKAGIPIKRTDINNWSRRGWLRPVDRKPLPTYLPHEVLDVWNERSHA